jgi:hypothetical protein
MARDSSTLSKRCVCVCEDVCGCECVHVIELCEPEHVCVSVRVCAASSIHVQTSHHCMFSIHAHTECRVALQRLLLLHWQAHQRRVGAVCTQICIRKRKPKLADGTSACVCVLWGVCVCVCVCVCVICALHVSLCAYAGQFRQAAGARAREIETKGRQQEENPRLKNSTSQGIYTTYYTTREEKYNPPTRVCVSVVCAQ